MATPFNSENIITHKINEIGLSTFLVGFDINDSGISQYRLKPLIQKLCDVIQEFAFGFHEGDSTDNTKTYSKLIEAAQSIYKIDAFQKVKDLYENNGSITDDVEDKFLRRGEFGELILHLLLRDFHNTIPLLSKVYFKDSLGHAVHEDLTFEIGYSFTESDFRRRGISKELKSTLLREMKSRKGTIFSTTAIKSSQNFLEEHGFKKLRKRYDGKNDRGIAYFERT